MFLSAHGCFNQVFADTGFDIQRCADSAGETRELIPHLEMRGVNAIGET